MDFKPHPYQTQAINFALTHPACGLFLDMGAGKTVITLKTLSERAKQNALPSGHILVIAPLNIARSTWPSEMDQWNEFKNVPKISLIEKENGVKLTKKKRDELMMNIPNEKPSFYFINRELITSLVDFCMDNFNGKWYFPTIIIDELQGFKSASSQRFKSLKKILPQTQIRIGLTGTPASEGLDALWSELYFLDYGFRLGRTMTTYHQTFFNPGRLTPQGFPYEWIPKPNAKEHIIERISDIVCSVEMPKEKANIVPITYKMSSAESKTYKRMIKDRVLNPDSDEEISASNAAVLAGKLMQLSSGAIYPDEDKSTHIEIHRLKLQMLEDIIDHEQGQNIIVFYWFGHEKQRIMEKFPDAVCFDGSRKIKDDWNNGNIKLLLLQPASAGHGLNLQFGGHIIVWFQLNWSLELWLQGNARLARQGQTESVTVYQCLIEGTIDEKIANSLKAKELAQKEILDSVDINAKDVDYMLNAINEIKKDL